MLDKDGQGLERQLSPEWKEMIHNGAKAKIESCARLLGMGVLSASFDFSPIHFSDKADERDWDELSVEESEYVKQTIFDELGVDQNKAIIAGRYEVRAVPDEDRRENAWVDVLSASKSSALGLFIHERRNPDGTSVYTVASKDYRPPNSISVE